ncbi:NmrA family NAD(P)-binding protein [Streptomyces sp. NPDC002619]|uniref:NmrA family NAD(P)-binding protein n=1 Tax=Streptomyces sp. NPDC002619 TaxID=3364655 RepID=UPI0036BC1F02
MRGRIMGEQQDLQRGDKVILVTGATGRQGGAVTARLLANGWTVRALTRSSSSRSAAALAEAGVQLAVGHPGDRASLKAAVDGVHGVFSVQPGTLGAVPVRYDTEIAWGRDIADVALAAGAAHLVFASVAGAERSEGVRAFEPKLRIEEHIRRIGAPATILRPVSFMENYADPAFGLGSGTLATPLAADVPEQLVALQDIGAFAAMAFDDPDTYLGLALDIVGDALTPVQIAQALSRAIGRHIPYVPVPINALGSQHAEFAEAVDFLNRNGGYGAELAPARELHRGLLTFDQWLTLHGTAMITALMP